MIESIIEIYQIEEDRNDISVILHDETVWLSLTQMSELFHRDKSVISRHINNIYKERELIKEPTVANFATVQLEGDRQVARNVDYYNLDVIISVGYRVKSQQGTRFRIWANKVLREYLINGFSVNDLVIKKNLLKYADLQRTIKVLGYLLNSKKLESGESEGLLRIISDYSYALDLLDQYDLQSLQITETSGKEIYQLTYDEAIEKIQTVKSTHGYSDIFGREKDKSLKGSLSAIYQTFDGVDLYPSVEEKAAHLLYFITKNHPFADGNKRIAAFLFLYFLERNGILFGNYGIKRIPDNALVALTLMIATSKPEDKDIMIKVTVNLINKKNNAW